MALRQLGGGGGGTVSDASVAALLAGGTSSQNALGDYVGKGAPQRTSISAATVMAALGSAYAYYKLPPGLINLDAPITMPAGSHLDGCGMATIVKIAGGRTADPYVIGGIGDGSGVGQSFTLGPMIVDGNKAGGSKQTNAVVYFEQPSDLTVTGALHCRNGGATVPGTTGAGGGFRVDGMGLAFTFNIKIPEIHCYGNDGNGLEISHTTRKTLIGQVYVHDNLGHGYWFDASEQNVDMILARDNAKRGVFINNVHTCNIGQILAWGNGWAGIWVEEFVFSVGHDWIAVGNGASDPEIKAEVAFTDANNQTYGITHCSEVHSIRTATAWYDSKAASRVSDYGVYVADGVIDRVTLTAVEAGDAGKVAPMRLPAIPGSLVVRDASGTLLTGVVDVTNQFTSDPAMAGATPGATNWTATNGTITDVTYLGRKSVRVDYATANQAHVLAPKTANRVDVSALATGAKVSNTIDVAIESGTFDGIQLTGRWFDAGGAVVLAETAVGASNGFPGIGTGWSRLWGIFTKPAGAVTLGFQVSGKSDAQTGVIHHSHPMVSFVGAVMPYGDGSVAGWQWDGTANASVSRKPASSPSGSLLVANALSELAGNAAVARGNLALGSMATQSTSAWQPKKVWAKRTTDATARQNNTLANDDTLAVALAVGTYNIKALLRYYSEAATAKFQFGFVFSGTATMSWTPNSLGSTVTTSSGSVNRSDKTLSGTVSAGASGVGTANAEWALPEGIIDVTVAGTLTLQWAQVTTNATDTVLCARSTLIAELMP
jgi:hypothetical protein